MCDGGRRRYFERSSGVLLAEIVMGGEGFRNDLDERAEGFGLLGL